MDVLCREGCFPVILGFTVCQERIVYYQNCLSHLICLRQCSCGMRYVDCELGGGGGYWGMQEALPNFYRYSHKRELAKRVYTCSL
jgi:hypothetical protein